MATDHSEGDSDDGMVAHIQQRAWTVSSSLPFRRIISQYCGYFPQCSPLQFLLPTPSLPWTHTFTAVPCLGLSRFPQLSTAWVDSVGPTQTIGN